MNRKVDGYIGKSKAWQEEMKLLRKIILECKLTEELKWRSPCYTLEGKNVVLFGTFKEYCALLFVKGALLKDSKNILVQPGQTQAGRQVRLTSVEQIKKLEPVLKAYIKEAIEIEKSGKQIVKKTTADFAVPVEFQIKLDQKPALKAAFEALTPGRQRAYLYFFSGAKQSKTREARVEKYIPQIMAGKGIDD